MKKHLSPPTREPREEPDQTLVRATSDLLATDDAIERLLLKHSASSVESDIEERADYQALDITRNEHIATLIIVSATSMAGVQAKVAVLRSPGMIEDFAHHQQIAVSLADDLIRLDKRAVQS
jgi:hypothetical protein